MKYIAVIMTVHNRCATTIKCLNRLISQQMDDYRLEIFLTDDGCTDDTVPLIKNYFPDINIIPGDGSLFWNRGTHVAWKAAVATKEFDFFLWLNDDSFLFDKALIHLIYTSHKFNDGAIIIGSLCAVDDKGIITYGGRKNNLLIIPSDKPQKCNSFNGNVVLIPSSVFKKVGFNDYFYHHNHGDIEYGLRAERLGVCSYICSGVVGECDRHKTIAVWCDPDKTFRTRWKVFKTPLGHNPEEAFHFERMYFGFPIAAFHYFTAYIRVLFPWIWTITNRTK